MQQPVLRLSSISKSFGEIQANHKIDLDIYQGKILALVGENGAGKSTLMSILSGKLQPDDGDVILDGERIHFSDVGEAIKAGVGIVSQHFHLIDSMTVAENVFLSQSGSFFLRKKRMTSQVAALAQNYGIKIDPGATIAALSMAEKQLVEILKLLQQKSNILIFDESTAPLTSAEVETLFKIFRNLAGKGKTIIFISHKLAEVMAIADDIAILCRGEVVERLAAADISSVAALAGRMIGRQTFLDIHRIALTPKQIILKVEQLQSGGLQGVDLELRKGEILGIVGVAGNGQKPLVESVCGISTPEKGKITILGMESARFFEGSSWEKGLSYIPEDSYGVATCQDLNLLDNFLLTTQSGFVKGPWLQKERAKQKASQLIENFGVQASGLDTLASELSGGNLKKMVLARAFYCKPRLIVIEQPTQGLDISGAEEVWKLLLQSREQAGVLLVTSDVAEALALSDRIAVMFNGKIVDTFPSDDMEKVEQIPQMMVGVP